MDLIFIILFAFLLILLYLSGYFSSLETAFVGLDIFEVKQMVEDKVKNAKVIAKLKRKQHKLLITILIGNNLVNIGASSLATYLTIELIGSAYIGAMTGVLTLFILVFGEITPKSLASVKAKDIAIKRAKTISLLMFICTPIIKMLDWFTKKILKMSGYGNLKLEQHYRMDEKTVRQMVTISQKEGEINEQEREMIHNIFEFDDQEVKGIMTPRTDMFAIDLNDDVRHNINQIMEHGFSRVPVYSKDVDKVIGILFIKDLMKLLARDREVTKSDLMSILRKPIVVPGNKKVDALFNMLRREGTHMAMVVDEYGGIMGIVTMEDLVEEIVGEIYDETDEEDRDIIKLGKRKFRVDGGIEIDDLNREIGTFIDKGEGYETISGFILDKIERVPEEGEIFEYDDFIIRIELVRNNRIEKVKITLK